MDVGARPRRPLGRRRPDRPVHRPRPALAAPPLRPPSLRLRPAALGAPRHGGRLLRPLLTLLRQLAVPAFFVNSHYLQGIKGYGAAVTGVAIMPLTIGMALVPRLAARWSGRPRAVVGAGLALIGVGLLGASTVDAATPYRAYACWLLDISAGTGLSMPALTLRVVDSLPPHQAGLGSGLGTTARETGAALGGAVTGTIPGGHGDLASGMGPALRTAALLVLAATALVVAGHGGRTPTRTIASDPERVLSRPTDV
ncbi:MFS transporter [Streptomyces sp. NPDC001797]|uniref:MFS transporter n=1 Tax=Streptomyces sp. NPDC001797 TaxID=3364610 RepID=UPI00368D6026